MANILRKKGVVLQVINYYVAEIKMLDFPDIIRIDQNQLETVIPAIGSKVLVVNGAYRGQIAVLTSIDIENYQVSLRIEGGLLSGRVVNAVEYEDISRLNDLSF